MGDNGIVLRLPSTIKFEISLDFSRKQMFCVCVFLYHSLRLSHPLPLRVYVLCISKLCWNDLPTLLSGIFPFEIRQWTESDDGYATDMIAIEIFGQFSMLRSARKYANASAFQLFICASTTIRQTSLVRDTNTFAFIGLFSIWITRISRPICPQSARMSSCNQLSWCGCYGALVLATHTHTDLFIDERCSFKTNYKY